MDETLKIVRLISPIELNLCMRVLGLRDWNDIPVLEDGEQLEKRMLEAFLHLTEMGVLRASGSGFEMPEEEQAFFRCIGHPKRRIILLKRDKTTILYRGEVMSILVGVNFSDQGYCRVCAVPQETAISDLLQQLKIVVEFSDESKEPPAEIFAEESDTGEIIKDSEAVFICRETESGMETKARILIRDMMCWFSTLGPNRMICQYSDAVVAQWIEESGKKDDSCECVFSGVKPGL